jgi:hypothetical protein
MLPGLLEDRRFSAFDIMDGRRLCSSCYVADAVVRETVVVWLWAHQRTLGAGHWWLHCSAAACAFASRARHDHVLSGTRGLGMLGGL